MNIFPQAPVSDDDTVAFKLLNAFTVTTHYEPDAFLLSYYRGGSLTICKLAHAELDTVAEGFSTRVSLAIRESKSIEVVVSTVRALGSYLVGSYINLNDACNSDLEYPILSCIKDITPNSDATSFEIEGLIFKAQTIPHSQLPIIELSSSTVLMVNADTMNKLWPGSSLRTPILKSLGYDGSRLIETLQETDGRPADCDVVVPDEGLLSF